LKDNAATVRNRDDTKQIRVKIKDLTNIIWKLLNGEIEFEKAGS
jgi:glycyl-tRNA synthetase (class II)